MKVLTIQQPWVSQIMDGSKYIEERHCTTHYRGPVAIHAGKGTGWQTHAESAARGQSVGVILGVVNLTLACTRAVIGVNCLRASAEKMHGCKFTWLELYKQNFNYGSHCWVLEDPITLPKPIAFRGNLGLMDLPAEIAMEIYDQLGIRSSAEASAMFQAKPPVSACAGTARSF